MEALPVSHDPFLLLANDLEATDCVVHKRTSCGVIWF
jgi:hypothetical protein